MSAKIQITSKIFSGFVSITWINSVCEFLLILSAASWIVFCSISVAIKFQLFRVAPNKGNMHDAAVPIQKVNLNKIYDLLYQLSTYCNRSCLNNREEKRKKSKLQF